MVKLIALDEYQRLQEAYDPDQRCGEPPDGFQIVRLEIDFAIPVTINREQERQLHELITSIVYAPCNQPKDGVHWPSGYGSRPKWSRSDAAFLGVSADDDAPESGEPEFDDSVFHIETTARQFVSDKERERTINLREKECRQL